MPPWVFDVCWSFWVLHPTLGPEMGSIYHSSLVWGMFRRFAFFLFNAIPGGLEVSSIVVLGCSFLFLFNTIPGVLEVSSLVVLGCARFFQATPSRVFLNKPSGPSSLCFRGGGHVLVHRLLAEAWDMQL